MQPPYEILPLQPEGFQPSLRQNPEVPRLENCGNGARCNHDGNNGILDIYPKSITCHSVIEAIPIQGVIDPLACKTCFSVVGDVSRFALHYTITR